MRQRICCIHVQLCFDCCTLMFLSAYILLFCFVLFYSSFMAYIFGKPTTFDVSIFRGNLYLMTSDAQFSLFFCLHFIFYVFDGLLSIINCNVIRLFIYGQHKNENLEKKWKIVVYFISRIFFLVNIIIIIGFLCYFGKKIEKWLLTFVFRITQK